MLQLNWWDLLEMMEKCGMPAIESWTARRLGLYTTTRRRGTHGGLST